MAAEGRGATQLHTASTRLLPSTVVNVQWAKHAVPASRPAIERRRHPRAANQGASEISRPHKDQTVIFGVRYLDLNSGGRIYYFQTSRWRVGYPG